MELVNGQTYLMGLQVEDFKDNLAVVALAPVRGATIAQVLEQHVTAIKADPALSVEVGETRTLSGREVAFLRYSGKVDKQQLRITSLIYLLNGSPVVVTATVAERNWEMMKPRIDALFAGVRIGAAK